MSRQPAPDVEFTQELEDFLVAVVLATLTDHSAFDHLDRSEQSGCAVPNLVMGEGAAAVGFARQPRSGAVQRLELALPSTLRTTAFGGGLR